MPSPRLTQHFRSLGSAAQFLHYPTLPSWPVYVSGLSMWRRINRFLLLGAQCPSRFSMRGRRWRFAAGHQLRSPVSSPQLLPFLAQEAGHRGICAALALSVSCFVPFSHIFRSRHVRLTAVAPRSSPVPRFALVFVTPPPGAVASAPFISADAVRLGLPRIWPLGRRGSRASCRLRGSFLR